MPVKPLRRLQVQASQTLFDRLSDGVLQYAWSRGDMDALERDHPKLIVERDGNILAAFREGSAALAYSFRNEAAFVDHFPAMFEALLPRLKRELRADTVRFRLAYAPAKPTAGPVLRRLSFVPQKPWMGFVLKRGSLAKTAVPKGVTFRAGGVANLDEVVEVDRECFPNTPMPKSLLESFIREDRLLFAVAGKAIAGMAIYSLDDGLGYLSILGVREAYRGRGIGAALTTRVAKELFAEGATEMGLRTDEDNSDAIRLYRSLGFAQRGAGCDYERPTEQRVIDAMQKANEGTLIRFGGWR